ncbi:capsular biosynthesis protein, partial [Oscillatoriales cyanobacterium LEGE 11467]
MTQSHLNETAEADLGYGQLFGILVRQRYWFSGIFIAVLCATAAITLKTKPTYRSTMQLLVEPNYPQKQTLERTLESSQTGDDDYATQLALMRSSQFTEEVAARLRTDYPDLEGADIEQNLGLSRVEAGGEETQIFAAVYTDGNPVKTQKILETLQQVYQEYNLEQEKLRLTQGLAFIDEQSETARDRLIQLEDDLEAFRANENFIDPQQQANSVAEALDRIEGERRTLRAQYEETQARYGALQGQLTRSPKEGLIASRLSQSSRYQALLDELQKTELTLAQERLRLTNNHPDVEALQEQRQRQLTLLAQEQQRVLGLNSAPPIKSGESLRQTGQLGKTDQDLVDRVLEVQAELRGLQARDRALGSIEEELRAELDRFPKAIAKYNRLQPEVEIQRNTITQLLETRQALSQELARGGFNWQVVEPPQE